MENYLKDNLYSVKTRMLEACDKAGVNPSDVTLIGVTKTVDVDIINASIELGITDIAENKVQEVRNKYEHISNDVKWHLIGHLQTNKVKYIIDKVNLIHSVDSLKLAKEISKRASQHNLTMEVLIQVNIADEAQKFGVAESEVEGLIDEIQELPNIQVKGLMNIAPFYDDPEDARVDFKKMKEIFDNLSKAGKDMTYLSMGMSGDFHIAIEEGANLVRVGSSIYGMRNYN